jgi:DNA repair exonuclease SbcCD nuclease subunit
VKIALITDTHFGARGDNTDLLAHQEKFFQDVFFQEIEARGIKHICHLGDLVDRRKYINFHTASHMRRMFFSRLGEKQLLIIVGNHDCYWKNTNSVNALHELGISNLPNTSVYTGPAEIELDGTRILLMPWIAPEQEAEALQAIQTTKAEVLFGHLELKGFEMYKGSFSDVGYDADVFGRFDVVCSGHFHHKSTYGNINYLGTPYEMTWADFGDPKGFHIFDTSDRSLEFIPNPLTLFKKVKYDDAGKTMEQVMNLDFTQFRNSYVKVIVSSKENPFVYDTFIQKLEDSGVTDVRPVDDHLNLALVMDDDIVNQAESTLEILQKTVKQVGVNPDYEKDLESLLRSLYNEASLMKA